MDTLIELEQRMTIDNDDLLNRQEFIDRVVNIIDLISLQKGTKCFAINGRWGIGKTFVLNKLEQRLEIMPNSSAVDKYVVFHYNCWQYDYYEEPLIAIVSSMLDTIDSKENLIPKKIRTQVKGLMKTIGNALLLMANDSFKATTKIDLEKIVKFILDAKHAADQEIEDTSKFDANFIFKKALEKLQQTLAILSKEKTIIIVVDELDRCLPEYTIKVLERLHHVFEGVDNTQVILSIDKGQLEHIVKQTFGQGTQTEQYLAKFIDFYVDLDEGNIDNELFVDRFYYYTRQFEYLNSATKKEHVSEFVDNIFNGIDMRKRIQIIDNCYLLHQLLNSENAKKDFVFLCLEISFSVLKYWGVDFREIKPMLLDNNIFNLNVDENNPTGIQFLNNKYRSKNRNPYIINDNNIIFLRCNDVWSAILYCYRFIVGYCEDYISPNLYNSENIAEYTDKFVSLLYTIN